MNKTVLREKLLSRQFLGHVGFFMFTTAVLMWFLFNKCEGQAYDHESAYRYLDLWQDGNLWNLIGFGSMNGLKTVAQFLPNRRAI